MNNDKIIIKDSSTCGDMLNVLNDMFEEANERKNKSATYIHKELDTVNSQVGSILHDMNGMSGDVKNLKEAVNRIEKIQSSSNTAVLSSLKSIQKDYTELAKRLDELSKVINSGGIPANMLDRKIDDLHKDIEKLSTRTYPSADEMVEYTVKMTKCVAEFITVNKPNLSKFSQSTKSLFKSVLSSAEAIGKRGPEIKATVKNIMASNIGSIPASPVRATRAGQTQKPVQTAAQDKPTGLDKYAKQFCLGKSNSKQTLAVVAMISFFILFAVMSYIMISGSYETMSLGSVKLFGFIWKLSTLLISFDAVVLVIILILRVLATLYCLIFGLITLDGARIRSAIINIVLTAVLIAIGFGVKNNFYVVSKDLLRIKDLLLADNIEYIGRSIQTIFEYWRIS